MPFDTVSVEIVEDAETCLWMWRVLASCSVVWLRQASSSGVGPVGTGGEWNWSSSGVGPVDNLVRVVNDTSCPEVSLSILSYETVESILFGRGVQGYGLHSH